MTKRSSNPTDAVLVAIDMSKHRQEVLIERPDPRRRTPTAAIVNLGQGQQPTRLVRALRHPRQSSQRRSVKIFPQANRFSHSADLQCHSTIESDFRRLGNPPVSQKLRRLVSDQRQANFRSRISSPIPGWVGNARRNQARSDRPLLLMEPCVAPGPISRRAICEGCRQPVRLTGSST